MPAYDYDRTASEKLEEHPNIRPWFKPWVEREYGKIESIESKYMGAPYKDVWQHLPMFTVTTERGVAVLFLNPAGTDVIQKSFHPRPKDDDSENDYTPPTKREPSLKERVDELMAEARVKDWTYAVGPQAQGLRVKYEPKDDGGVALHLQVRAPAMIFDRGVVSQLILTDESGSETRKVTIGSARDMREALEQGEQWWAEKVKQKAVQQKVEQSAKKREQAKQRRELQKQTKPAREDQRQARARILAELARQQGWEVRPNLKVPWAKKPRDYGKHTVYFKGVSAIYIDDHSMHIDIRGMPIETFIQHINREIAVRDRSPEIYGHYR